MIFTRTLVVTASVAAATLVHFTLGDDLVPNAESFDAASVLAEVSLYQGRAMASRTAAAPEREGLFEMRFTNLPASVDPDSLQATVTAPQGGAKRLRELLGLQSQRLSDQNTLLTAIATKTATESAKDFGSGSLDPSALAAQVEFIGTERGLLTTSTPMDRSMPPTSRSGFPPGEVDG
ncbi:MAG: hypothetical protein EXS03_09010 [Phycisphaerales bacterium]|nr:hypothetical protein [Phycisphaerales bacterium]